MNALFSARIMEVAMVCRPWRAGNASARSLAIFIASSGDRADLTRTGKTVMA